MFANRLFGEDIKTNWLCTKGKLAINHGPGPSFCHHALCGWKNMTSLPQIEMNQQWLLYESLQNAIAWNWNLSVICQLEGLCIAEQRYSITPIHLLSRESCWVHAVLLCLPATVSTEIHNWMKYLERIVYKLCYSTMQMQSWWQVRRSSISISSLFVFTQYIQSCNKYMTFFSLQKNYHHVHNQF